VDNNIFEGAGDVNVMAGTFTVTSPIDTTFLLDGALFLLPPPMFADIPNLKSHPALSQVVPDDSVVQTSSLMPVTVSAGCTSCGLLPVYDGGWAPAPSIRVSPFLSAFAIFDETEPAPEPSTAVLFGLALLGAGVFQLRRSQYFRPKP
jgi:hypothetical protein